jgi:hypothetical protein
MLLSKTSIFILEIFGFQRILISNPKILIQVQREKHRQLLFVDCWSISIVLLIEYGLDVFGEKSFFFSTEI